MAFETISLTVAAFVGAALAIASLLHQPRSRTSLGFCAMSLSLSAHDILCVVERYRSMIPFNSHALHGATILLLGPAAGWFGISLLPAPPERLRHWLRLFFFTVCAAVLIFTLALDAEQEPWFVRVSHQFILVPVAVWLIFFYQLSQRTTLSRNQIRFKQTFWGAIALALFFLTDALALTGAPVPPLGTLTRVLYLLLLFQLFVRRQWVTWEEVAARLALFIGLAAILALIYHLLTTWIGQRSDLVFFASFIASSVILILFEPIVKTTSLITRRLFLRREQWMELRVAQCSKELLAMVGDRVNVAHRLTQELKSTFGLSCRGFFLLERDGYLYRNLLSETSDPPPSEIVASDPLVEYLVLRQSKPLVWEPSPDRTDTAAPWERSLIALKSEFVLPFYYDRRLLGFAATAALGPSLLTPKRIRLLTSLSRQVAYLLRNAEMVSDLRDSDRNALASEMAAGLAHEIKNPLGAIKGAAEILKERSLASGTGAEPTRGTDFLNIIVSETDRLTKVLSEFLDYARPRQSEKPTRCDLIQVLEHTAKIALTDKKAEFTLSTNMPRYELEADPDLLKQIFLNLFINSLDAITTAPSPEIRVEVHERHASQVSLYEVVIRDNGAGIPVGHEEKIFDPFFTTKHQGTGLGLSICRRLLAGMRGTIFCRPSESGAAFVVHLPRAPWKGSYA